MTAIPIHHTATDTKSTWDGPAEVAKAPNVEKVLRYMHTWVDPEGDPNAKGSYKFPHHDAGSDTPANIAGVDNALARLSQADIPDGDRAGVKAHLEAHRKDAGVENVLPHRKMPIRCFEGNAKPYEPFWTWRNAADGEDGEAPEMELYGYISEYSWSEDDITPAMFRDDLNAHGKGGPVTIRMNSYGGDVIAASVMSSIIKGYAGKVTVQIDGIAASAATVVAIAGEQVRMQEGAYFMIHDPMVAFFLAVLNIEDLSTMVDQLKVVKDGIINAYESKTGLSRPRLAKMMADETWMDAKTAQNLGFADEVITGGKKKKAAEPAAVQTVAMINALNALKCYQHVPEALKNALNPPVVSDPRNAGGEAGSRGHAAGDPEAGREAQQLRDYLDIFA